jgi:tripartite-type tricarboxylate transporter receptor subunit TctC
MSGWFGLFAPKGTPKEIIARINGAMVETLADPAVVKRLAELGLDVAPRASQTPEGLAAFHKAEIDKWWPIIKSANIKGE